jgi:hypothetical protein
MLLYTQYTGMTIQDLLKEAISEAALRSDRLILLRLAGFRQWLQNEGYAPTSTKALLTGIRSFYACHYVEVPKLRGDNRAATMKEHEQIPTLEDLQAALKVCDPLEKAIL